MEALMSGEPTGTSGGAVRAGLREVVRIGTVLENDVDAGDQTYVYIGSMRDPVQVTGSPLEVARKILTSRRAP
jgi:hypothetical protein